MASVVIAMDSTENIDNLFTGNMPPKIYLKWQNTFSCLFEIYGYKNLCEKKKNTPTK